MEVHALLLLVEATVVAVSVLTLFRARRLIGLSPLFLAAGAFQYLQIVLAASVYGEVAPGLYMSPGSIVLFPIAIFVVLLIYVEGDADEARKLAVGVVIANAALSAVSWLAGQHLLLPHHANPLNLSVELFQQSARVTIAGTAALFVDIVATIFIFELVNRTLPWPLFPRLWLTATVIMVLDTVLFAAGGFLGTTLFWPTLIGGLVGKSVSAAYYSALVAGYIRFVEPPGTNTESVPSADMFGWLSYRQRYEAALPLVTRDALTGLFNRRYFDELGAQQVARAARDRREMSIVLIDADGLKAVNDGYGHQMGDSLVALLGDKLRTIVRASDAGCRYGGDEFAVVLSSANATAARVFADRFRDLVAADTAAPWGATTVTMGIASFPADGTSLANLVACADARLYQGKRAGGGLVIGSGDFASVTASALDHFAPDRGNERRSASAGPAS